MADFFVAQHTGYVEFLDGINPEHFNADIDYAIWSWSLDKITTFITHNNITDVTIQKSGSNHPTKKPPL